MEQALILMTAGSTFQRETIDKIRAIPGVTSAFFLYGSYDIYAMVKTNTRDELRNVVIKIREVEGIKSTTTCNVISTDTLKNTRPK
jgi:DNA-binding Lrp family transcriptional regulator